MAEEALAILKQPRVHTPQAYWSWNYWLVKFRAEDLYGLLHHLFGIFLAWMEGLEKQTKELLELGGLWDSAESLVGCLADIPSGQVIEWIVSVLQQSLFASSLVLSSLVPGRLEEQPVQTALTVLALFCRPDAFWQLYQLGRPSVLQPMCATHTSFCDGSRTRYLYTAEGRCLLDRSC